MIEHIASAEHKAETATHLWEVILERAYDECTPTLLGLLELACDINQDILREMESAPGGGRIRREPKWSEVCIEDELRRAVRLLSAATELNGDGERGQEQSEDLVCNVLTRLRKIDNAFHKGE